MKVSKYFDYDEVACRCCGNVPDNGISPRLLELLDSIREALGKPMYISCAYRCPAHNAEVGGVSNSQHVLGTAADIQMPEGYNAVTLGALATKCGAEGIGLYPWGVHVDMRGYDATWDER